MIERVGSLWDLTPEHGGRYNARVITTNGSVDAAGKAVFKRGCSTEAFSRWNPLAEQLGEELKEKGNHVTYFPPTVTGLDFTLVTFPVRNEWSDGADKYIITRSAIELRKLTDEKNWTQVIMPRPGCGNTGGFKWEGEIRPLLGGFLDDRFHVVDRPRMASRKY